MRLAFAITMTVIVGYPAGGQELLPGPQAPVELEAFLDDLVVAHLDAYESAGAAVSVVMGSSNSCDIFDSSDLLVLCSQPH